MFRRFAVPTRRAIFFAREAALDAGSGEIDSTHLRSGLLVEQSSRVNQLLQVSSRFQEETARMRALKRFPQPRAVPLSRDSKRIVAGAAAEADRLNEYWVDTDHVLLAILLQGSSPGARALTKAGLQLDEVRAKVSDTATSRENYGTPPPMWWLERPVTRMGKVGAFLCLLFVLFLFRLLTENGCGSPR
jgi:ATP-dependent Clp protease ATP-binding subunit ClpA